MQTKTNFGRYSLLFFFLVLLFTACNSNSEEKKDEKEMSAEPSPIKNGLTGGTLDTLSVAISDISTYLQPQGAKLVFSFTFETADKLTLHGWAVKPTQFDSLPNIKLKNYFTGPLSYGVNTYFGNIVLGQSDIAEINNKIRQNPTMKYILFAPDKIVKNYVVYRIILTDKLRVSKDDALVVAAVSTDAYANPSPPKTY